MNKDIEIIEKYLLGTLNVSEAAMFNGRMANDEEFQKSVLEYKNALNALQRAWVKDEIGKLKRIQFFKKIGFVAVGVFIFVSVVIGSNYFKSNSKKDSKSPDKGYLSGYVNQSDSVENFLGPDSFNISSLDTILGNEAFNDSVVNITYAQSENSSESIDHTASIEWQEFIIDNSQDSTLFLKGGTKITFFANTLKTENSNEVLRFVHLRVKEFVNYYHLWLEGLPTVSNQKMLETGGACYIEANSIGEEVRVKNGCKFILQFPGIKKDDMETFYGQRLGKDFNWMKDSSIQSNLPKTDYKFNELRPEYHFDVVCMDEGIEGGKHSYNTLVKMHRIDTQFNSLKWVQNVDIRKLYYQKKQLQIRFNADSNGVLTKYDYNFELPRMQRKSLLKKADSLISMNKKINLNGLEMKNRIINVNLVPKEEIRRVEMTDSILKKAKNFGEKNVLFNKIASSNFGYINCDRFVAEPQNSKVSIVGLNHRISAVHVFFKDVNSYVKFSKKTPQETITISNVPLGKKVLILAITDDQNAVYIIETETDNEIILDNEIPFDLIQIRDLLSKFRQF